VQPDDFVTLPILDNFVCYRRAQKSECHISVCTAAKHSGLLECVWFRGYNLEDEDIPNHVVRDNHFSVWLKR
jgi:hypothetical protein